MWIKVGEVTNMGTKSETLKRELLSAVLETRTAVLQAASGLSPTAQDTVFLGIWSVVDLIARGYPIRGTRTPSGTYINPAG